jgi:homocysteine S-methyltransferase
LNSNAQNPIERFLAHQPFIVLDGALATELERRGADLKDPLWSAKCLIQRPDLIQSVHQDYFAAGADVAITASYQATFEGFQRRGLGPDAAAGLMRAAVALAAAARDEFWGIAANRSGRLRPLIAASVGPYGAMLADGSEYRGHYACSDRDLRDFHRRRLDVLASCGVDLLACETLPCLREALTPAELLAEYRLPAWISFSCRDESRNHEGEDIAACAEALQPYRDVAAIGVNCTDPRYVSALLRRMASVTGRPLVAYPNSGEQYDANARTWMGRPHAETFADQSSSWFAAGARLIGGCCRTTPADIKSINARRN